MGKAATASLGAALLALASTASAKPIPAQSRYVAMGSSFAAGPGIPSPADTPPTRCARSTGNYAHLLAKALDLALTDVSCSGATTAHILGPWNELPPQILAVTPDTALVTVTIGGNDVGYIGGLMAKSCLRAGLPADAPMKSCPAAATADEAAWRSVEDAMRRIASAVRERAPRARLVFVDYPTLLPERGTCAATPLDAADAAASRETARRLAAVTARVAAAQGAGLIRASALSKSHHACAKAPWTNGYPRADGPGFVPYHPNAAGMAAIAEALRRYLAR
jgi:lysophospholipase L1-like esterase